MCMSEAIYTTYCSVSIYFFVFFTVQYRLWVIDGMPGAVHKPLFPSTVAADALECTAGSVVVIVPVMAAYFEFYALP